MAEEQEFPALHRWLEGLLPADGQGEHVLPEAEVGLLALRARAALHLGAWDRALRDARRVFALAERLKDWLALFEAHQVVGELQWWIGEFAEAVHSHQDALRLAQDMRDIVAEAEACLALAAIHSRMGNLAPGHRLLERARRILANQPHSRRVCRVLAMAIILEGLHRFRQGRVGETFALYQEALCLLTDDPRSLEASEAWRALGVSSTAQLLHRRALECHMHAMEILSSRGCRFRLARLYGSMGQSLQEMGRVDEAILLYERAVSICSELGARVHAATIHGRLGQALLVRGDVERAMEHLGRDQALTNESGGRRALALMHRRMGQGLCEKGCVQEALGHFDESLLLFEEMGDELGVARLHREIALARIRQGQAEQAREAAVRAQVLFSQLRLEHEAVHMQALLGVVARLEGELDEAENRLQEALVFFTLEEPMPDLAETLYEYGVLQEHLGNEERAREHLLEALRMARGLQLHALAARCFARLDERGTMDGVCAVVGDLASRAG